MRQANLKYTTTWSISENKRPVNMSANFLVWFDPLLRIFDCYLGKYVQYSSVGQTIRVLPEVYFFSHFVHSRSFQKSDLLGRTVKREVLVMSSKECEPSSYRHGNDPPKQVETASLKNFRRALSPSATQSSFDPFTYIPSKVTESQAGKMSGPINGASMSSSTIPVVVPCLLHAVNSAIQAYRRSYVRIPQVPVGRVKLYQGQETVSRI
jgi:hypothetical protein